MEGGRWQFGDTISKDLFENGGQEMAQSFPRTATLGGLNEAAHELPRIDCPLSKGYRGCRTNWKVVFDDVG